MAELIGMTGDEALAASKNFTKKTVKGMGAIRGEKGEKGNTGADGKSAYDIWLEEGNVGSEQDFLNSLQGKSVKSVSKDENNNIIVTFSDGTTEKVGKLNIDVQADFLTSDGFGNIRFTDNKFQYYDKASNQWADTYVTPENSYIITLTPQPMESFTATCDPDTMNVSLKIIESKDTIVDGQSLCIVEKVIIRRKKNEFPINENDGDLVLEIARKDFGIYKNRPYIDVIDGVVSGDTYYYKAFPVSNTGAVANISDNEVACKIKDYLLYGFKLDQLESDPASMITYIEDNIGYKSAYMDYNADAFNYSDWKDVWFIKNIKPCMLNYDGTVAYELDPNDYSKKLDGTNSDITNVNFAGNVMIGIPKVYWKIVDNGDDTANIYFSNKKVDENFACWSHIDNNGNEIDYCYMPAYNGYSDGTRLRSLSDKTPINKQLTSTEISLAVANNVGDNTLWNIEVFSDRMLINLLLILIGKSTDTQTIFGYGHTNTSYTVSNLLKSGTLDNKGLFYGTTSSANGVKVFGMENLWGNQGRRVAGWIVDKGTQKIKLTYGQSDGSTVDGYNTSGSGYIDIGCTPSGTSGGYINKMSFTKYGLVPVAANGSATTYYADALWFNVSKVAYAIIGNGAGATKDGLFTSVLSVDTAYSYWSYASAISCKPLATI